MNDDTRRTENGASVKVRRVVAYAVLILMSFLCLIWFYILFINASRSHSELSTGFTPIPSSYALKNFMSVIRGSQPFARGMLNSLIISVCCATLSTYFSAMTAYAIHVYDFKLKKFMFTFILMIMMIPTQVTALGFLQLVTKMKLEDNFIPLIVPTIAAPAVFFYMKQYMESALPLSLVESARIDGAGEFRTFNQIVLPLMRPAIAVQAIFSFVQNWNNYFTPALILHKDNMKTLPILIATLRSADFLKFDMGSVYMSIAFSIFPVIIVYLILSKNIVGGVAAGAVKG
ncbi:MAG: carbohydrate ABC transporter permease [Lachnospiraceae bacterium]|nr:carbohydrate ABC transporter permease [Lachnospiraceae bacterium]